VESEEDETLREDIERQAVERYVNGEYELGE